MKPLLFCLATLALTGCTTVSMVSKQAIVETELTDQQSEVRERAQAFEAMAADEGWVRQAGGLSGLADMLFGAEQSASDASSLSYAQTIAASAEEPAAIYATVEADASAAARSLQELDLIATALLQSGDVQRADLISFESALVTAQKCYRSFAEATGVVEGAASRERRETEAALRLLAGVIDGARLSADQMAAAYADAETAGETLS
ncbi:MAG: hypothetical protein MK186_09275 [Henriciella sp.]|uniref:Lipoprotein n=2 Tax=Henriciella marina TaxID=453851 RepID=A0ABT4LZT1_9PROT|nr:hypothetical protein [Henriciella sp.]MCZ4298679.1 hypothetical protein [Henriciella marina]